MSQRAVETALGKLICDDAFRREFYEDPETAIVRAGFHLTSVELSCLRKIALEAIEGFASQLDDRVRRAEEPVLRQPTESRQARSHHKRS